MPTAPPARQSTGSQSPRTPLRRSYPLRRPDRCRHCRRSPHPGGAGPTVLPVPPPCRRCRRYCRYQPANSGPRPGSTPPAPGRTRVEQRRQGQKTDSERVAGDIRTANKPPPRASESQRAGLDNITRTQRHTSRMSSWNGDSASALASQMNIDRAATYSAAAISARCRGSSSMSIPCHSKPGTPCDRAIKLPEASRSLIRHVRRTNHLHRRGQLVPHRRGIG